MKAIVYNKKCQPDRLVYCDIAKPAPNDSQVLIKISSVSLNAADKAVDAMNYVRKGHASGKVVINIT